MIHDYDSIRSELMAKAKEAGGSDERLLTVAAEAITVLLDALRDTEKRRNDFEGRLATAQQLARQDRRERKEAEALLHRIRRILPNPQPPGPR